MKPGLSHACSNFKSTEKLCVALCAVGFQNHVQLNFPISTSPSDECCHIKQLVSPNRPPPPTIFVISIGCGSFVCLVAGSRTGNHTEQRGQPLLISDILLQWEPDVAGDDRTLMYTAPAPHSGGPGSTALDCQSPGTCSMRPVAVTLLSLFSITAIR